MKLKEFEYGEADLVYDVAPSREGKPTRFDQLLQSKWNEAMANGHFWYKLDKLETRILPGKYGFVAQPLFMKRCSKQEARKQQLESEEWTLQLLRKLVKAERARLVEGIRKLESYLNVKRAQERRKPQHVNSISMPFDGSIFNFTKLKEGEMLFSLKNANKEQDSAKEVGHWIVINVSPIEYCNSLLVPSLYNCLPQILTPESLRLAIDTVLLSGSPNFRLGFNSLGGHASVNHHHFHLYYLEHRLYIETARVNHLWSECYEIVDYPAKGFVFQVTKDNKETVVQNLMVLVQMLLNTSTAHNLFVTRGTSFQSDDPDGVEQPVVRVFLWARRSCYGAKDESTFNVALCELSGRLIMKSNEGYLAATEDSVSQELCKFCNDTFAEVRSQVVAMNKNCNSSPCASPSNS